MKSPIEALGTSRASADFVKVVARRTSSGLPCERPDMYASVSEAAFSTSRATSKVYRGVSGIVRR